MSQADILHQNTILHARSIVFPLVPKVSDGAKVCVIVFFLSLFTNLNTTLYHSGLFILTPCIAIGLHYDISPC